MEHWGKIMPMRKKMCTYMPKHLAFVYPLIHCSLCPQYYCFAVPDRNTFVSILKQVSWLKCYDLIECDIASASAVFSSNVPWVHQATCSQLHTFAHTVQQAVLRMGAALQSSWSHSADKTVGTSALHVSAPVINRWVSGSDQRMLPVYS